MNWTEMKKKVNEIKAVVGEFSDPKIDETARIEKGGVIKSKFDELEKSLDTATNEYEALIDKYYNAVNAGGTPVPPKPQPEEEEPPKTLDEFTERFIEKLGDKK